VQARRFEKRKNIIGSVLLSRAGHFDPLSPQCDTVRFWSDPYSLPNFSSIGGPSVNAKAHAGDVKVTIASASTNLAHILLAPGAEVDLILNTLLQAADTSSPLRSHVAFISRAMSSLTLRDQSSDVLKATI
jgi:hypothetical protein